MDKKEFEVLIQNMLKLNFEVLNLKLELKKENQEIKDLLIKINEKFK